jgi:hypothetical protein
VVVWAFGLALARFRALGGRLAGLGGRVEGLGEQGDCLVGRGALGSATSGDLEEILRVGEQTRHRGDRLKCLVEWVILTKRSWGARSGGVDELIPAASWVGPNGPTQIVIRQPPQRR